MGLITLMVIIGAAVVGVTVTVTLVSIAPNIASRTNRELRTTRYQLSSANKALRSIANGAGNPALPT